MRGWLRSRRERKWAVARLRRALEIVPDGRWLSCGHGDIHINNEEWRHHDKANWHQAIQVLNPNPHHGSYWRDVVSYLLVVQPDELRRALGIK